MQKKEDKNIEKKLTDYQLRHILNYQENSKEDMQKQFASS